MKKLFLLSLLLASLMRGFYDYQSDDEKFARRHARPARFPFVQLYQPELAL
jgi:hypothetical protein